ncbi:MULTISPECIES: heavy-metal-associated domain-containing protein [Nitrospirillum]|uniref:Heavy metal transporter n=1 Tax=Nitrospirillum viridazoti CBAmc TaxID=1441467 RepID=A0A248JPU6_9PROT|nr:heavy-metal-associated domain-containing protein [Nitrospirillum amazonense]ASG20752.1 heavy metal transporter [Nitrospirillum amazonense CBAmc]MEC4592818.1 heavy-metal-associated domain-containing protein [Nitrospirillum amazonense]TWB37920.1 copper chaperone [Nitrospirillum amazonense]
MSASYRIDGMTCQGCARSVTKAIQAVAPAAEVDVDVEAGVVTVTGPADGAQVRGAVEDAGFDFVGPV